MIASRATVFALFALAISYATASPVCNCDTTTEAPFTTTEFPVSTTQEVAHAGNLDCETLSTLNPATFTQPHVLEGNLTLEDDNTTSANGHHCIDDALAYLNSLQEVRGDVHIHLSDIGHIDAMTASTLLHALKRVQNDFVFISTAVLYVDGLSNLEYVGGDMRFLTADLVLVDPSTQDMSINNYIKFPQTYHSYIEPFWALRAIGGNFEFSANQVLGSDKPIRLVGFDNLEFVHLISFTSDMLRDVKGFNLLGHVDAMSVMGQSLREFELPSLHSIGNGIQGTALQIEGIQLFDTHFNLPSLRSIGADLFIFDTPSITAFNSLWALEVIMGDLHYPDHLTWPIGLNAHIWVRGIITDSPF